MYNCYANCLNGFIRLNPLMTTFYDEIHSFPPYFCLFTHEYIYMYMFFLSFWPNKAKKSFPQPYLHCACINYIRGPIITVVLAFVFRLCAFQSLNGWHVRINEWLRGRWNCFVLNIRPTLIAYYTVHVYATRKCTVHVGYVTCTYALLI